MTLLNVSPQCFTAAKYIREQLPSSPLWVLENEEKRCYKLWNHTKSFSSLGDEIQLKYDNINENGIDNHRSNKDTKNTQFTSITNIKHECNTILNLQKAAADDTSVQTEVVESININESETHNLNTTKLTNSNSLPLTSFDKISGSKSRNIIRQKSYTEEIDKNTVHKMTDINVKQQKTLKNIVDTKTIPKVSILKIISNTLCSWITVDTLIYILGEDRVKEYCKENSHQFKSSIDLKLTPKQLEQYAKLCKKLDLMEIQEDLSLITKSENLKPLPDYEYLKQENHKLMIKVRAFYGGKTEISVDELSTDDTTIASSRDRVETVFLPLNDQYDQIVKRRGIVLSYLDPILAKLLLEYNINENISFELQQLINTFELDATNITFKPAMQKLLALFILGLMSLQYNLKEKLNNILSSKLFAQILNAYNVHVNEFINIINDVTDIEKVISARKI
ncbi:putative RNA polymerase II subunit B1 CTD phosphatase RPAP2 isoform X2 [Ctenocephalides felis]|uniref:putative RNA polymerase II subunit B1 CTD phosphatase RPAP2 isoform X2 n=1 Tax=Ctenocephalides felis TaxID=7515 RepID=UPI000E6E23AF|nr:putative RNA polymerase II subunit B1 CTD phosphatase RPAP2 isoform X2 [Ctenocephalides felis]